ncbi:glycosyltransferase family 4 protein [Sulfuricurvum sp.]|uniref:glycosyltransferase family 4 protein n=1 Tax=Sulfuricurvum sp. TaxID=2025608 RepID=UPI00261E0439|nr:glycosyltransferase family 4 protein [Sulfuricurvum sp.]MDD4950732.1 glycosyltransferase family 4 protein [Sulfuricurvum sp.]
MTKHIAIIDHVGKKAGMDYYSSSLAKGFITQKCNCTVYSNFVGIDADKIEYKPFFDGHTKANSLIKLFSFLNATIKASFNAKRVNADLVILHLFAANIVTLLFAAIPKLFGLKIAIISHDVSSFADNDNMLIQHIIYNRLANFIIVHNQFSYKTLLESIHIGKPENIVIIKHGGYLDHVGQRPVKTELRQELGLDEDGKYILFFGQIKKVKGLDILLEAMNKIPDDIKLIIAGKPWKDDFSYYDELIEKYSLQQRVVKMIRFIDDAEREKLFFTADVNVLPYRIIYQSGVLLMAMSHGLPVIASNLPANQEILENGKNGLLFNTEDSDDLAQQLKVYFSDSILSDVIAKNGLKTIDEEYGWNDIAKNYIDIISH